MSLVDYCLKPQRFTHIFPLRSTLNQTLQLRPALTTEWT